MGITRQLPRTDAGRDQALTKGKNKNDSIALPNQIFTAPTKTRLDSIQPLFKARMQARANAQAAQSGSTGTVVTQKEAARNFISSFFIVLNQGIKRKKYPKADRAYFQVDVNSDAVPSLGTEQEITQWGERIVSGDAARIAAGGVAMANPTAGEVNTEVLAFNTENTSQSTLLDATDTAQEGITALHTEADGVIKKVWDEAETFYNEEAPASKRANCRQYGVVYVSTVKLTFNLLVRNVAGQVPVENAVCLLVQTGNEKITGADGRAIVESNIADEATFRFTHPDFVSQDITLALPADETSVSVTADLVHV